ncbi:cation-translocating P-type ATPase [Jannaschia sp. R86511]|uniref:cation-translocating P-type ATPase n=1 Tax=Jannaschia sp. R86511 TaxID=3093853 RepID=UPI0036D367F1
MTTSTHHSLPVHELVVLLGTDGEHGLSEAVAGERLKRLGPNRLPTIRREPAVVRFLRQLNDPLVYVLVVAGVAAAALGEAVDAGVIGAVVTANAVVGFVQEQKAQGALDALSQMVEDNATVLRSGQAHEVSSEHVVPGDVVVLAEGERVPADLRLVSVEELTVDESTLTGESLPVTKEAMRLPGEALLADRTNMAWSGTLVTRGRGRGVVVAHGPDTELGRVHRLMGSADDLATPLTRTITTFSRWLTGVILALAAVAFVVGLLRGQPLVDIVTAAVALAVAAIPEGLPAVVTVTLAIGVTRMARHGAIVRRLPAVETLGSTTTICTDKTGTLTQNRQTVVEVVTTAGTHRPGHDDEGTGPTARLLVAIGVLCNDAHAGSDGGYLGDPTETALLTAAESDGVAVRQVVASAPRTATLPFASERRLMATRHTGPAGARDVVHVKGAAEAVMARCRTERGPDGPRPLEATAWHHLVDGLAAEGLRVLACATGPAPAARTLSVEDLDAVDLELVGLVAMTDPPRPAAVGAIAACLRAGVRVTMITGDHAATARSIGQQVGLAGFGRTPVVMTGRELAAVADADLPDVAARTDVFARVSPEDKLRLVRALQSLGQVVAMTGDGVNDAPALEQADIGVAMGRGGTEVAQEAADMVLTDDDFASIEAAVEEGRGVFDNLVKFITFALPTNIGQGLVILTAILLGTQLPITPVQILWVNLTSAVLLGLPLAIEAKEPGIMTRPPRASDAPLVGRSQLVRMLLVSALLLLGAFGLFQLLLGLGTDVAEARTAAVNLFVLVEAAYLLSCRSFDRSLREIGWRSNPWLLGGIAAAVALQVVFTYAPFMHVLFGTAPVGWFPWLVGVAYAGLVYVAVELLRVHDNRRRASDPPTRPTASERS